MALSSDDVVNWQLKTGMRGYLIPQVDELLDEVADELDRLHGRIRELEAEREAVKTSLDDQLEVEETLRRTLYQAQKAADQTIEDAKTSSVQIVADGRLESDAILAAAREQAQATYDEAVREATDERAAVRSSLEAEEARMRAVRSELRSEVERLRSIESDTRRLLRGLYEDRLNELDTPSPELPDFDEIPPAPEATQPPAAPVAAAPVVPMIEAAEADDAPEVPTSESSSEDLVVMPPGHAVDAPSAPEPHAPSVVDENSEDDPRAMLAEAADVLAAPDDEDDLAEITPAVSEVEGRSADGAPAYLDAVHEALAAIEANNEDDAVEDDLLRDGESPDVEPPGAETSPRPRAEDLFDGAPPRRRRRSG